MAILRLKNADGSWVDVPEIHGENAYEGAVRNGFTGTEAEFYDQLSHFTAYANQAKDAADRAKEVMDSIPQDYQTLDQHVVDLTEHIVEVSETQPTNEQNKLWIQPTGEEVRVPTYEEFEELRDSVAPIEENSTFSRGYSKGENFIHNGGLCETTEDVAQGDTITVGTNCSTVPDGVGGEIHDLKSALDESIVTVYGKNIANTENLTLGILNSAGVLNAGGSAGAAYKTTDFIELEANTDYSYAAFYNNINHEIAYDTRKVILLYNASKEPVSETFISQTNVNNVTFSSGSAYKYARLSYQYANYLPQLEKGTTYSSYAQFESHKEIIAVLGNNPMEQINGIYGDYVPSQLIDLHSTETDEEGVLYNSGGLNKNVTDYKTSAYIKVKSNNTYIFAHPRKICFYNEAKEFLSVIDNTSNAEYTYTAEQDCLMRFSYAKSQTDSSVIVTYNGSFSRKLDESIDLSIRQKEYIQNMINENNGNPLYGKKWAVCGDSFTNSGGTGTTMGSGKYATRPYTYPWIIGTRCDMDIVRFFEGGRTLAFPAEPGTFTNSLTNPNADWYYQNIPEDVDYITIYLGINDEHHSPGSSGGEDNTGVIPIGTVDDNTTATYLGAWNVVLTWLITNRPNAHIGIIVTNGIASKDEYRLGQIAIAQKYGIPYIDLNGDARTPAMLRTSNPNIPTAIKQALIAKWAVDTTSDTHPNDAAQLFESTFIENFLRTI